VNKLFTIFLLAFIIIGLSGVASAANIHSSHEKSPHKQSNVIIAPHIVTATIINNPGATIAGGKIISITGGQTITNV